MKFKAKTYNFYEVYVRARSVAQLPTDMRNRKLHKRVSQ